jgi:hypothetical protein
MEVYFPMNNRSPPLERAGISRIPEDMTYWYIFHYCAWSLFIRSLSQSLMAISPTIYTQFLACAPQAMFHFDMACLQWPVILTCSLFQPTRQVFFSAGDNIKCDMGCNPVSCQHRQKKNCVNLSKWTCEEPRLVSATYLDITYVSNLNSFQTLPDHFCPCRRVMLQSYTKSCSSPGATLGLDIFLWYVSI